MGGILLNKNLLLVVGIIFLFIGISIQPAIAVNPNSIDSEEDCDICPKVSNQHLIRLRSLIDKLEINDNKLSDKITTLSEMNKILNSNNLFNFLTCFILTLIIAPFVIFIFPLYDISETLNEKGLLLMSKIVYKFFQIALFLIFPVIALWLITCTSPFIFE